MYIMLIRKDNPLGKLVSVINNPDGTILETYEVEILGVKCRYFHFAEFEENNEHFERFTGNKIILN